MPGDYPYASDIWGTKCGGNSAAPTGCNGNNDKKIGYHIAPTTLYEERDERFKFWQHLKLAEMINQAPDGTSDASYNATYLNMYNSKVISGMYQPQHTSNWSYPDEFNMFTLGQEVATGRSDITAAAISPYLLNIVDNKIDNRASNTGIIRGYNGYISGEGWNRTNNEQCCTAGTGSNCYTQTEYNKTIKSVECMAIIKFPS